MMRTRRRTPVRRAALAIMAVAALVMAGGWGMAQAETGSAGALDDSFGDGGVVVNDYASLGWACATQSTGLVIVAGEAIVTPIEEDAQGYVARYELDGGRLDASFGTNGWVTVDLGSYWTRWYPRDVVVDAQDKIIVVGYIERVVVTPVTTGRGKKETTTWISEVVDRKIAVLRLLSTGVADSSFGTSGLVTTDIAGCDDEWANSVVLLADGGLVVGGAGTFTTEVTSAGSGGGKKGNKKGSTTTTVSSRGAILIRFDQDGDEVLIFGTDGVGVVIDNPNTDDGLGDGIAHHGLGVQVDTGRIVYLTHGRSVRGCDLDTGVFDDNFNEDALSTIATYGDVRTDVQLSRLAVNDSDEESILISGGVLAETDGGVDGLLIRMSANGQSAFEYTLSGADDIHFAAIGIDDVGGIAVGCNAGAASEDIFVVRLHVDLTLDLRFETAPTVGARIEDIAFDGDDIVLAGTLVGSPQWLVVRYLGN